MRVARTGSWALAAVVAMVAPAAADHAPTLRMRAASAPGADVGADPADPPPPPLIDEQLAALAHPGEVERGALEGPSELRPGPTTVLTRADLATSGRTTLGDILQALPVQANAANAQINNGGDGATRISLRGLGAARTVVLLDGHRIVAAGDGVTSSVDLNAIPLAVVERVEIWRDAPPPGVGADAIGGVINIVTRRAFDHSEATLSTGTSLRGDGVTYDASLISGYHTADRRGSVVLSAGYQHQGPTFAGDRPFARDPTTYDFRKGTRGDGRSTATLAGRLDASSIDLTGTGHPTGAMIAGCPSGLCKGDGRGGWTDFVAQDDLYNFTPQAYLTTPSSRLHLFSTARYQLTEGAAATFEGLYVHRDSAQQLAAQPFLADAMISKDSLYNPFGGDIYDYRRRLVELGPRRSTQVVDTLQLVGGIEGTLRHGDDGRGAWRYEVSYGYGRTGLDERTTGGVYTSRLADALGPSMRDASGTPICVAVPGDVRSKIQGCVPLNILGPVGAITPDQTPYIAAAGARQGLDDQHAVQAIAHGEVVRLPVHGELSAAVGVDYRREVSNHPSGLPRPLDIGVEPPGGQDDALGAFGELALRARPVNDLIRIAELTAGARVSSYQSAGTGATYKLAGRIGTTFGLTARATAGTALRPPTVSDRLRPITSGSLAVTDPCDAELPGQPIRVLDPFVQAICTAQQVPQGTHLGTSQQPTLTGGNDQLGAERARITTVGLSFEPRGTGLSIAADYWRIHITDAIAAIDPAAILRGCYELGIDAACAMIHRDPVSHQIRPIDAFLTNASAITTSGLDLAVAYDHADAALGKVHGVASAQYLLRDDVDAVGQVTHGRGVYDLGLLATYRANLATAWSHPSGAGGGFTVRYVGAVQECDANRCSAANRVGVVRDIPAYTQLDLFASYALPTSAGTTSLTVGVTNLLDAAPPAVYNAPATSNTDATTYDFMGRMVYARLAQQF
jgi:iron complex outermembrane recepter protein